MTPVELPRLTGPGLALFRATWFLTLGVATIATLGGAWMGRGRFEAAGDASGAMVEALSLAIDLLPPVMLVATAVLLYARRGQDVVAALLSLAFLMLASAFFAAEGFFREFGLEWLRVLVAHAGRCALLLVLLAFPDGRFMPRWTAGAALLLPAWAVLVLIARLPLDLEYLGYLVLLGLSVIKIGLRYRVAPPGLERQQIRWVLFGFALGAALLGVALVASIVARQRVSEWVDLVAETLPALAIMCFALGLIVSLLRYRLYDAEAAISRSAGYALLTLLIGGVFAASIEGAKRFFETSLGSDAGALPAVTAAALAAVLITPAHNLVHGWAERRFQKALALLRRDLPECVADLRETAGMAALLDETLARIAAGVRAGRAAALVGGDVEAMLGTDAGEIARWRATETPDENVETLDCDTDDPLFPMRIPLRIRHGEAAPIGWILLGPRPDGSFYGKDERDALAEIADPVARAVEVVRLREARETRDEARLRRIEARLEAIEAPPIVRSP